MLSLAYIDTEVRDKVSGWGTNEGLIISIIAHRNSSQRNLIQGAYAAAHGEDLLKALDKELSSDFERVVLLSTLGSPERDAYLANEATKRLTSSNWVLMEIATTRSSEDLFLVRRAYHKKYKKSLEEDVAQHTTGDEKYITNDHDFELLQCYSASIWSPEYAP
ncbi:hypothetical protein Droror1_Dr00011761 [Drosera rotundifolia]